jgi:hypothetical protein
MPRIYTTVPLSERFAAKVAKLPSGCWRWTGFIDKGGYGRIQEGRRSGAVLYAHRIAYEQVHGAVPEGCELDHLCRNRWCCNPDHLEAVSHRVNVLRGYAPTIQIHRSTTCSRGHEWNEENTYYIKGYPGKRQCRACKRERRARAKAND